MRARPSVREALAHSYGTHSRSIILSMSTPWGAAIRALGRLRPHVCPASLRGPWGGTSAGVSTAVSSAMASLDAAVDFEDAQRVKMHVNTQATGAFQSLPMVAPSREIIDSAVRRSQRIGGSGKLKNEAARARNKAARQLDAIMKELTMRLGEFERGFPQLHRLHPFEAALLELTVGVEAYNTVLARVGALRKAVVEVSKGYAARASKAANKKEAVILQEEGLERVQVVFGRGADAVDELKEVAKALRRLPVVDPALPTVALVGAPNVGKSSLVQLLSSGLPEVQNYPFTTRSIKMGHFYVDGRRHQVTDTPGLLNRLEESRNAMEKLTLASLQHLPTATLFVADLTGECGTTVTDQWAIRAELKRRFPTKPWIDVLSKADMLGSEFKLADERLVKDAMNGNRQEEVVDVVRSAVDFASSVPDAVRVSSLTGEGIDLLKDTMMRMLSDHDMERHSLHGINEQGRAVAQDGSSTVLNSNLQREV